MSSNLQLRWTKSWAERFPDEEDQRKEKSTMRTQKVSSAGLPICSHEREVDEREYEGKERQAVFCEEL